MGFLITLCRSSIGKKIIVGVTGLCLCVYLVVHVGGNLLLFKQDGGAAFDEYADTLPSFTLIRIIEYILYAIFVGHIAMGTYLWLSNRRARPQGYSRNRASETSSISSRTMFLTGSIVFIFLVIHMKTFWYTSRFEAGQHFSMFLLVKQVFSDPAYSAFYVLAMFLLGFHLRHGFQSAFQTFGLKSGKFTALVEGIGVIFWLLIPLGFAAMPVYFLFLR